MLMTNVSTVRLAALILLLGLSGCTAIGAGVGAMSGAVLTGGSTSAVVAGAIVGGVIGNGM
jgi:osmotically inducible lipoprotein OsmB